MSSAQKEKQEIPLCLHIRNFLIRFLYRAKPVSEMERSGIERALRTRDAAPHPAAAASRASAHPSPTGCPGPRASQLHRMSRPACIPAPPDVQAPVHPSSTGCPRIARIEAPPCIPAPVPQLHRTPRPHPLTPSPLPTSHTTTNHPTERGGAIWIRSLQ